MVAVAEKLAVDAEKLAVDAVVVVDDHYNNLDFEIPHVKNFLHHCSRRSRTKIHARRSGDRCQFSKLKLN